MKTFVFAAFAAAALSLTPGTLYAADQFTLQGVKHNCDLQRGLNGPAGFGPLERSAQGSLFGRGFTVEPLSVPDGSERLLENPAPFSLESGVESEAQSLPPSGTFGNLSKPVLNNEPPSFPPDAAEDFQD